MLYDSEMDKVEVQINYYTILTTHSFPDNHTFNDGPTLKKHNAVAKDAIFSM